MKKYIMLWLVCCLCTAVPVTAQTLFLSTIAEKGNTYMSVAPEQLTQVFGMEGGSRVVPVNTNLQLFITSSEKWCKATGIKDGLSLTLEANAGADMRTATVEVVAKDGYKTTIHVSQLGTAAALLPSEKMIDVVDANLDFTLSLAATTAFTFELPAWVQAVDAEPAVGFKVYTFRAEALTEPGERIGNIIIRPVDASAATVTVPVKQLLNGPLRFAVMSDIHFGSTTGDGAVFKVSRAFKNVIAKGIDAIVIPGDLTQYGLSNHYDDLLSVFNSRNVVPEGFPVYVMMGNHDWYGDAPLENYYRVGQPLHQYFDIKGYPFITLSMPYDDETLRFLSESLARAAAEYPGKPVFLFTHIPPANTVYGTLKRDGNWGTPIFEDILKDYPQVVMFCGHTHFPLGDPRSIDQRYCTVVNDGGTNYAEMAGGNDYDTTRPAGTENTTEAVIVNLDKDMNIRMERWNTYRDERILPDWNVLAPHDGTAFIYKGLTGGTAPAFAPTDAVIVTKNTTEECVFTFPQATDDEIVNHYVVEVLKNGISVRKFQRTSFFFMNSQKPSSIETVLRGLEPGDGYTVSIRAIDSYENESQPLVSDVFSVAPYAPDPSVKKPVADLFDIVFGENGTATDVSASHVTVTTGATIPATRYNETFKRWGAVFTDDAAKFFKVDYSGNEAIKAALLNGFTVEAFYKSGDSNGCPLSTQQVGGAGIMHDSGKIGFYIRLGGSWIFLDSGITPDADKYVHVVFTYDKVLGKLRLYVNGMLVDGKDNTGEPNLPGSTSAQWFGIGGDASGKATVDYPFDGEMLTAKLYSRAITRDEVYRLYEEYKDEGGGQPVDPVEPEETPVADLLDVEFGTNGAATDKSPAQAALETGSTKVITTMEDTYGRYVATFNKDSYQYYRVPYTEGMKQAFGRGFSMETMYCDTEGGREVCPFSGQESGGTGFFQTKSGEIMFYIRLDNKWVSVSSGVTAEPGKYYHVIGAYDKESGKLDIYVDGTLKGSLAVSGEFTYPANEVSHAFAIGGDISKAANSVQYSLKGNVMLARMYSKYITSGEALGIYNKLKP